MNITQKKVAEGRLLRTILLSCALVCAGQMLVAPRVWAADETPLDAAPEEASTEDTITEEAAPDEAAATPRIAPGLTPTIRYLHYDATGNVVAATDAAGGVTWRAQMQPFGLGAASVLQAGEDRPLNFIGQPIEYAGDANNDSSGLYQLGARYYDPMVGRFMGADPLAVTEIPQDEPQRYNRFAYGLNNPYRYVDTSGANADDARKFLLELAKKLPEFYSDPGIKGSNTPVRELTEKLAKLPQSRQALVAEGAAVAKITQAGFMNWLRNAWSQGALKTLKSAPRSTTNFKLPGIMGLGVALVLTAPSIAEAAETSSDGRYGSTLSVGYEYMRGSVAFLNPLEHELWINQLSYSLTEALYGALGLEEYLPARQKTGWEKNQEGVQELFQALDQWLAAE